MGVIFGGPALSLVYGAADHPALFAYASALGQAANSQETLTDDIRLPL